MNYLIEPLHKPRLVQTMYVIMDVTINGELTSLTMQHHSSINWDWFKYQFSNYGNKLKKYLLI